MSSDFILKIADFLSSDEWWNEITEYKETNCVLFMNDLEDTPNHKEFLCFKTFLHIITNLIDVHLCQQLGIDSDKLEQIIYDSYLQGNHKAKVIVETLQKTTDFLSFREDMVRRNKESNDEMDEMIEELAQDDKFDDLDDNALEKSLGRIVENSQNQSIFANSQKYRIEMEKKLSVPVHEPSPNFSKSIGAQTIFQPKEPHSPKQKQIFGQLGPLHVRTELIKRNTNKPTNQMPILKPSVIRSPHIPKLKNTKCVLPPLSV